MRRRGPIRKLGNQRAIIQPVPHVRQIELANAEVLRPTQHAVEVRNEAARLRQEVTARLGATPPWWIDIR